MKSKNLITPAIAIALLGTLSATGATAADESERFKSSIEFKEYRDTDSFYEMRASDIIGADVINALDEEIGEVDDLVVSREDGTVNAIISVGGFLGLGEKMVVVPYDQLRMNKDGDEVYMNTTKEELETDAGFEYNQGETFGRDRLTERKKYMQSNTDS